MTDSDEKAARLAAQLRANLQRRKARQRAVAQAEPPPAVPKDSDPPR